VVALLECVHRGLAAAGVGGEGGVGGGPGSGVARFGGGAAVRVVNVRQSRVKVGAIRIQGYTSAGLPRALQRLRHRDPTPLAYQLGADAAGAGFFFCAVQSYRLSTDRQGEDIAADFEGQHELSLGADQRELIATDLVSSG